MLDQVLQQGIGEAILVGPLGIPEDAVQPVRVGFLDTAHGLLQAVTDVGALLSHVVPVTAIGYLKAVLLGEQGEHHILARLAQSCFEFLIIDVGEALEEEQREDVGLEIRRIHGTTQDIGGLPEVRFKLTKLDQLVPRQ